MFPVRLGGFACWVVGFWVLSGGVICSSWCWLGYWCFLGFEFGGNCGFGTWTLVGCWFVVWYNMHFCGILDGYVFLLGCDAFG